MIKIANSKGEMVDAIAIPVDANNLYQGEKSVYLELVGYPKEPSAGSKDTHLLKQNFKKEFYEALPEDEKKNLPIVGNAIDWKKAKGTSAPKQQEQNSSVPSGSGSVPDPDDLPF